VIATIHSAAKVMREGNGSQEHCSAAVSGILIGHSDLPL
jgi:hypothetical protein